MAKIVRAIGFPYRSASVCHSVDYWRDIPRNKLWYLERSLGKLSMMHPDNHTTYLFQTDAGKWYGAWFHDFIVICRPLPDGFKPQECPSEYDDGHTAVDIIGQLIRAGLDDISVMCQEHWSDWLRQLHR